MTVLPSGVSDWRNLGYVRWDAQGAQGELDGTWYYDGKLAGRAVGNAKAGTVGLVVGLNVISVKGTFSGNVYSGQYETAGIDLGSNTGQLKLARR
ncbi:hypothetical protein [Deinococcus yunweiensis]|uniref:hypothetical protein n=1 Tax=Deinococcus yunweiensis TaxID=367282 RepID=UPI00398EA00C